MPFNIWCGGCERHIARGVRFNAEKKQIGQYHSTPILSFLLKCPSCSHPIDIHTDPANAEYIVATGGRRKNEQFDPESVGLQNPKTKEEAEKLIYNPFFKLEKDTADWARGEETKPRIERLIQGTAAIYKEDHASSRLARKRLRAEKKEIQVQAKKIESLKTRLDIHGLPLLPELEADVQEAATVKFRRKEKEEKIDVRIAQVKASSVFGAAKGQTRKFPTVSTRVSLLDQLSLGGPKTKK